ncbi:MAG: hypothetical protein PHU49_06215 [Syntrophorhabdaceae bacterium]|nr:hypothetical protein [Syntrophorhabdaceae bacterium]MDD5243595.1 hypothetical protein [Syntrophorhabdaceae bacterium]
MKKKTEDIFLDDEFSQDAVKDVELFLGFEEGTFDHIPHYCREEALEALLHVRKMEEEHLFRPGLYYAVLSDLCRATQASLVLGNDISRKRIETFILTCVDALGHIETTNYHLFLREIGDAVLLLFSSFEDAYLWWRTMHSWLEGRNKMWTNELDLSRSELKHFKLEAKTIIHAGEIAYSGTNIPVSAAINQVFKVEKEFKANELGITHHALACARPVLRTLKLRHCLRGNVTLPGDKEPLGVYLIDNYEKTLRERRRYFHKFAENRRRQQDNPPDPRSSGR